MFVVVNGFDVLFSILAVPPLGKVCSTQAHRQGEYQTDTFELQMYVFLPTSLTLSSSFRLAFVVASILESQVSNKPPPTPYTFLIGDLLIYIIAGTVMLIFVLPSDSVYYTVCIFQSDMNRLWYCTTIFCQTVSFNCPTVLLSYWPTLITGLGQ